MSDRLDRVEARLQQVEDGLSCALRKIDAIERREQSPALPVPIVAAIEPRRLPARASASPAAFALLPLVGRTVIILGGAYLLRALTETGRVGASAGVALGFVYAVGWFGVADQTSVRRRISGVFHGLAAVLIGLPLLWEASGRFHVLSVPWSVTALAIWTAAALLVAWHRRLQELAALGVIGAVVTTLVLIAQTGTFGPFALFLSVLALATWRLSVDTGWSWLRWPTVMVADVLVASVIIRALAVAPTEDPFLAIVALLVLMAGYYGAFVWQALVRWQTLGIFECLQTTVTVALGLFGAAALRAKIDLWIWPGVGSLGLGLLAYAGTYAMNRSAHRIRLNVQYFATLGTVMTIAGVWLSVPAWQMAFWFGAVAIANLWIGGRLIHPVLFVHGAATAVLASSVAGLIGWCATIWTVHAGIAASFRPAWLAIGLSAAGLGMARAPAVARLLLGTLVVAAAASAAALAVAPAVRPEFLPAARTVVLSIVIVVVALVARRPFGREFNWLAYVLLLAAAVKLLLVDFAVSNASAMFVALAAYGLALTVAARLMKDQR